MPFRPQPADRLQDPVGYPAPDWSALAETSRIYVPEDGTVGWIVLQGGSLAWLSAIGPEHLGYPIRRWTEDAIRVGALDLVPPRDVWDAVLTVTLHTPPLERPLPDLLEEVREEWSPAGD